MKKYNMISLEKIKGVIFDLDGVLVDTERLHYLTWVEVLKPFGINFTKEDYFNYAGKREDVIEVELIKNYNLKNIEKNFLFNQKRGLSKKWIKSKELKLMPYSKEAVEYFANKKVKLAICSGGYKDEIIVKLKRTGFYPFFPIIVSGGEIERGKPYPDIYLLAAKKLGLSPKECLAFEDTQYGLESAKSAGLTCFAIPGEFSVKQDFSKADKVFANFKKMIEPV